MMMVTDLGDFKTVMSGGSKLATMGFGKGDKNTPINLFSSTVFQMQVFFSSWILTRNRTGR